MMRSPAGNQGPPPWQQCVVCVAARALVKAEDDLRSFISNGGTPNEQSPLIRAVKTAGANWDHARKGRHTGRVHTLEVKP